MTDSFKVAGSFSSAEHARSLFIGGHPTTGEYAVNNDIIILRKVEMYLRDRANMGLFLEVCAVGNHFRWAPGDNFRWTH
jgi:hypothetical protein